MFTLETLSELMVCDQKGTFRLDRWAMNTEESETVDAIRNRLFQHPETNGCHLLLINGCCYGGMGRAKAIKDTDWSDKTCVLRALNSLRPSAGGSIQLNYADGSSGQITLDTLDLPASTAQQAHQQLRAVLLSRYKLCDYDLIILSQSLLDSDDRHISSAELMRTRICIDSFNAHATGQLQIIPLNIR